MKDKIKKIITIILSVFALLFGFSWVKACNNGETIKTYENAPQARQKGPKRENENNNYDWALFDGCTFRCLNGGLGNTGIQSIFKALESNIALANITKYDKTYTFTWKSDDSKYLNYRQRNSDKYISTIFQNGYYNFYTNDLIYFVDNFSQYVDTTYNLNIDFYKAFINSGQWERIEPRYINLKVPDNCVESVTLDDSLVPIKDISHITIAQWESGQHKIYLNTPKDISLNASWCLEYSPLDQYGGMVDYSIDENGRSYLLIDYDKDYNVDYYDFDLATYGFGPTGSFCYNINYLQNKAFILNDSLDYSILNEYINSGYSLSVVAKENIIQYDKPYSPVQYMYLNDNSIGVYGNVDNSVIALGNDSFQLSTFENNNYVWKNIYSNGNYNNNYGIAPRTLIFTGDFNYNNFDFYYYDNSAPYSSGTIWNTDFVNFILKNSTTLSNDDYQLGLINGKTLGYYEALEWTNLIKTMAHSLDDFLNIQILPNITIKILIFIPIMFSILSFIIKAFAR